MTVQNEGGASIEWSQRNSVCYDKGFWDDDGVWVDDGTWADSEIWGVIATGDRTD